RCRGSARGPARSLGSASWSAASFGGPLGAGALLEQFGGDALLGVLIVSALAFVGAALWEPRGLPIHAARRGR
ncbi:MFS transporter, partial [Burkholderia pseudomallei]